MSSFGPFEFLFICVFGFVFLAILSGAIFHMVMFGKVFGIVTDRIKHQAQREQQLAKASDPVSCGYCQATIPAGSDQCPGCGAKRG